MITARRGTHQGSKHLQLGFNNQDGGLLESFQIPAYKKHYHVGIISDGCTGLPGFSKTEVGASLLPVFTYGRCQEMICAGLPLPEIPRALFQACTEFLRDLAQKVMPSNIFWNYPPELRPVFAQTEANRSRMDWDSTTRFRNDYLAATLLGFITDETEIVIFSAGDGIILINENLTIIDQDDKPDYPASSINNPGKGFAVSVHNLKQVRRLAIASDGMKKLMQDAGFVRDMFTFQPRHMLGLQILLNNTYQERDEDMGDDCTVITLDTTTVCKASDLDDPSRGKEPCI